MDESETLDRDNLRKIATYQRAVLICLLSQFLLGPFMFVCVMPFAPGRPSDVVLLGLVAGLILGVVGTVFSFKLSAKIYSTKLGVTLAIMTFIPLYGLVILLIINSRATAVLNRHGISVGLFGANSSDIIRVGGSYGPDGTVAIGGPAGPLDQLFADMSTFVLILASLCLGGSICGIPVLALAIIGTRTARDPKAISNAKFVAIFCGVLQAISIVQLVVIIGDALLSGGK